MDEIDLGDRRAIAASLKRQRQIDALRRQARIVRHTDPPAKIIKHRAVLERDLRKWLRFFFPAAFPDPWGPDHITALRKIERCLKRGGLFAEAMPRGHGKSTIVKGACCFAMLTGFRKYVMSICATDPAAAAILDFVKGQLLENDLLHEYYPHVTTYVRATEDKAIKARYQLRADGRPSGLAWGKATLSLPDVVDSKGKPYPSNGSVLETRGLTGAIRGKYKDQKSGEVRRPDFVVLDDPQTRESAESEAQCAMRERIIVGDVLGLAGPRKRIAAVMPCTIVRKGDLAARFLDHTKHPEWQGETFPLVAKWPEAQNTLWKEYADIYRQSIEEDRGTDRATAFYKAHRKEMDRGAVVPWKYRIRDGEISALQTAENLLIEAGEQFWAEYQNDPQDHTSAQYELKADKVAAHVNPNLPRLSLPANATKLVVKVDINRVGLHWCAASFDQTMTAHIPAYGRWPSGRALWEENATKQAIQSAIFGGLKALCDLLAETVFTRDGKPVRIDQVNIDRGYEPDPVHRFAQVARYPFLVVPDRGAAAHRYWISKNTLIGSPKEGCHVQSSPLGNYLSFNADLWREAMQRAFLCEAGAIGGCTLYQPSRTGEHRAFAEHIVAERLINKYLTDAGMRWEWTAATPGVHWDWGDALTGCWVAAAYQGLSLSGQTTPAPPRKRKASGVTVIEI